MTHDHQNSIAPLAAAAGRQSNLIHSASELQEVISRIVKLVKVERVYVTQEQNADQCLSRLIILVSYRESQTFPELSPLINTILFTHPGFQYRLFAAQQVQLAIKKGNLFLYDYCTAANLVYAEPSSSFILMPEDLDVAVLLEKAKTRFEKEMQKVQSFASGADFYIDNENYGQAAFMVHQHIEMVFRAIEQFAMGKDKTTHSIKEHQRYVAPYLPDMASIFNEHDAEEAKLMQHLDTAYAAVRYEDNFQINKDKLMLARDKGRNAQSLIEEHYRSMIAAFVNKHFEQHGAAHQLPGPIEAKEPSAQLQDLLQQLLQCTDVQAVYCFGTRTYKEERFGVFNDTLLESQTKTHYDLLVIANQEQPLYNFQGNFNSQNSSGDTILLLVHNATYIKKALENEHSFFHRVLNQAELLYGKARFNTEAVPGGLTIPQAGKEYLQSLQCLWFDRCWNARAFITAVQHMHEMECLSSQVLLLNQGMEQLCYGLLEVFLGYQPNRHAFRFLFDLCCTFLEFPERVFPRHNPEDKALFNLMANAVNALRYKANVPVSAQEMLSLSRRCSAFLDEAEQQVKIRFQEIAGA